MSLQLPQDRNNRIFRFGAPSKLFASILDVLRRWLNPDQALATEQAHRAGFIRREADPTSTAAKTVNLVAPSAS
jgi:hypothetical protein